MEAIFNIANKPSDFADRASPLFAKYLYWEDLFTLKSSANLMSSTFIQCHTDEKNLGGISKKRKLKDTLSIISVVAGLRHLSTSKSRISGRRGFEVPSVEGGARAAALNFPSCHYHNNWPHTQQLPPGYINQQ